MEWNGDQVIRNIERTVGQRVQSAGFFLVSEVRQMISIPSRTVKLSIIKSGKGSGGVKKTLGPRGSSRSRPGEPPHKDFGTLRQSIAQDYNPETITARVGSPMAVAKYLELGTKNMRPRPFLRRALAENSERIRQIIERGGTYDIDVS